MKHLVIADTQVKPGHDQDYLSAIGKYIAAKKTRRDYSHRRSL